MDNRLTRRSVNESLRAADGAVNGSTPSSTRSRSLSSLSNRKSLTHLSESLRARKVTFYRNGDQFFKGLQFALRSQAKIKRYQAFELLLAEVNASVVCDLSILKYGIRYIFTTDGVLITDVDQLVDGHSYVCSSTPTFKWLNYENISGREWVNYKMNTVNWRGMQSNDSVQQEFETSNSAGSDFVPTHVKVAVFIRAGPRPRRIIRKLLNKKTSRTFDQVLTMLAKELDVETGVVKYICSLYGRPVTELRHLFLGEQVFIVFGSDRTSPDDLKISEVESKFIVDVATGGRQRLVDRERPSRANSRLLSPVTTARSTPQHAMKFTNTERGSHCVEQYSERGRLVDVCDQRPATQYAVKDKHESALRSQLSSSSCGDLLEHRTRKEKNVLSSDAGDSCGFAEVASCTGASSASRFVSDLRLNDMEAFVDSSSAAESDSVNSASPTNKSNVETKTKRDCSEKEMGLPFPMMDKYKVGRTLYEDSNVAVKCCVDEFDKSSKYALKIVQKGRLSSDQVKAISYELAVLRKLRHENLLNLLDQVDTPREFYCVFELFMGSDLYDAIIAADNFRYSELDASYVVQQLLTAVHYLHSGNIVHRNIKLENILVMNLGQRNKQVKVKLGDFGLACEVSGHLRDVVGSSFYHAPEMFTAEGYGLLADIWAAGIVTYILLCGFPPGCSLNSSIDKARRIVFPSPYWDKISDAAKDLVLCMLEVDQFIRGSASELLEHPWIVDSDTANDIDIHESVARQLKDLFSTSSRHSLPNIGLIAVTAADKGMGIQHKELANCCDVSLENTDKPIKPFQFSTAEQ